MSRSAGNNWASGYKTYRNGQTIGFVPPLDRLLVRQASSRFLSQDERIVIADLCRAGLSVRQIAVQLSRAPHGRLHDRRAGVEGGSEDVPAGQTRGSSDRERQGDERWSLVLAGQRCEVEDGGHVNVSELLRDVLRPEAVVTHRYEQIILKGAGDRWGPPMMAKRPKADRHRCGEERSGA